MTCPTHLYDQCDNSAVGAILIQRYSTNSVVGAINITLQPASIIVPPGQTATFSVAAVGAQPLIYQWQFAGFNLTDTLNVTGSQTAQLTVSNVASRKRRLLSGGREQRIRRDHQPGGHVDDRLPAAFDYPGDSQQRRNIRRADEHRPDRHRNFNWRESPKSSFSMAQTLLARLTFLLTIIHDRNRGRDIHLVRRGDGHFWPDSLVSFFYDCGDQYRAHGARAARSFGTTATAGANLAVPVQMDALGDENTVAFSLAFNPSLLTLDSVSAGSGLPPGAQFFLNTNSAGSGQIGVLIGLASGQTLTAATDQLLVVGFTANSSITNVTTNTTIAFTDSPVTREIDSVNVQILSATYDPGTHPDQYRPQRGCLAAPIRERASSQARIGCKKDFSSQGWRNRSVPTSSRGPIPRHATRVETDG